MVQKKAPTPREKIYDLYWYFAAERQLAYERRVHGQKGPWSHDPILREFKFCNVYRAADRVSQYLIREVAYGQARDSNADRLFRIVAFRTFSKPETWRELIKKLQHEPRLEDLRSGRFEAALDAIKRERGGLYTGAFILCATKAYGHSEKHKNHVALFKEMFLKNEAATVIMNASSLEEIVHFLASFPLTGPFMSYQMAIDLNYSSLVNFSENDFTQAGPGALRGLKKAFTDFGEYSPTDLINWMVDRQNVEFERLGLTFNGLWGRPLHAIDCQGLFCELDKYCREAAPELVSNRLRIKARFAPSCEQIRLFFPPKWEINHLIPKGPVLGNRTPNDLEAPMLPGLDLAQTRKGRKKE